MVTRAESGSTTNGASAPRQRLMPQSLEAEQSTLGAMLLSETATAEVLDTLSPSDFYRQAHRRIFEAIAVVFRRNDPVDLVTVTDELRQRGHFEDIGGAAYLTMLINSVPSAANVDRYARMVLDKSLLRRLIIAADEIQGWAYDEADDVDALIDRAETAIFSLGQGRAREGFTHIQPVLTQQFNELEKHSGPITGVGTGYPPFDELTTGFHKSEFIVIAARPSMGKTAFCLNIAQHVALHEKVGVGIFSLEMSREQLVQRLMCSRAQVDANKLRTGRLHDDDWAKLAQAVAVMYEAPIYIDDTAAITTLEMRSKARRLCAQHDIGLLIVDYLQLVRSSRRTENRVAEVTEIAQSLKSLARELQVPLIACAQLSRAVEARDNKRPLMSDLRESGSIEAEADLITFIYRASRYRQRDDQGTEPTPEGELDIAEIIIGKQRNGPVGTVELVFRGEYAQFLNYDPHHAPPPGYGN